MSYYPSKNGGSGSLLVTGFDLNESEFAEVSIPELSNATEWQELTEATMLRSMTNFDGGWWRDMATEMRTSMLSGLL